LRKIRIIEHISLDGVIQAPGGPNEDPPYPYGGWAAPHHDPAAGSRKEPRWEGHEFTCATELTDLFRASAPEAAV
jgi:hypothetical protein